jgi:uncharacterized protein YkwD
MLKFIIAVSVSFPVLFGASLADANTLSTSDAQTSQSKIAKNNPVVSVFKKIDAYRQSKGLSPLSLDDTISAQAQLHSEQMARTSNLSHDGFARRISAISTVIPNRAASENVAYNMGYRNPDDIAIEDWLKSPGHLKNIVGNYNLTGVGVATNAKGEVFFTQIFVRK